MVLISERHQQTLTRPATVTGFGLFSSCDVTVEFLPADPDHGIVFERIDLPGTPRIPALIDYLRPQDRCTRLQHNDAEVVLTEHVLAALAGLHIDNCLIRIDAPELPIGDGSAIAFVEAFKAAGITRQSVPRPMLHVDGALLHMESEKVGITLHPARTKELRIGFVLDYGPGPIGHQSLDFIVTPESFEHELADCRTFALEREVQALRGAGLARRATPQNAVVFGEDGPVETTLRRPDECVRHKILDCIGDFALLGCDIAGQFVASRSGHRLNHEIIRQLRRRLPTSRRAQAAISIHGPGILQGPQTSHPVSSNSILPSSKAAVR